MPKTATVTSTKTATKRANAKVSKQEGKTKRSPSVYNLFVQAKMKEWKVNNPGLSMKDAMSEISVLWKDAPENPNRGKDPKPRKPKVISNKLVAKESRQSSDAEASGAETS